MNEYQIEKKARSGGKVEVSVSLNGKLIGKRTSARIYRFGLVVKGSQAHALKCSRESLIHQEKTLKEYQDIVNDAPGAREKFIYRNDNGSRSNAWHQELHTKWIQEGEVLKWVAQYEKSISALKEKIARLESGPQPEYDEIIVASWHQQRKNVPSCKDYQIFVDVVEIPE